MENIRRGDIFWIDNNPYRPTIGSVQKAGRPGIIVSNNENNENSLTFEIVYLSASPKKDLPTHCTITSAREKSTALCEQITTISDEQIGAYIGTCTPEEMMRIDICIAISLGLEFPKAKETPPNPVKPMPRPQEEQKTIDDLNAKYQKALADLEMAKDQIREMHDNLVRAEKGEELLRDLYNSLLRSAR